MEPALRALPVWADLLGAADVLRRSEEDSGTGKRLARSGMHNMPHSSFGCGGAWRKFGISVRRKPDLASVQTWFRGFTTRKEVKLQLNTGGRELDSTLGFLG